MYLRHLQLTDFRSWQHLDLELEPGPTVLIGPNGRGKTNVLEAVGYLATLGSHRVGTDAPLVRHDCSRALIRTAVVNGDRELVIDLEVAPGKTNRARINRGAPTRPREILGIVHTVLFAPEDLVLVKGDPVQRRRFLDELLVQRFPRLAGVRAEYDRVLRQRNALLKSVGKRAGARNQHDPYAMSTLAAWDRQLAELGGQLLASRLDLVTDLAPHVAAAYARIAGISDDAAHANTAPVGIAYRSRLGSVVPAEYGTPHGERADVDMVIKLLHDALADSQDADLERGVSLIGPHRDDLDLTVGQAPAKGYASHGESWSLALALRLGSYELLRTEGGEPLLLLDDVFAELDRHRRARLAAVASGAEQVLVTAAVAEDVPEELAGIRYTITDGRLVRE